MLHKNDYDKLAVNNNDNVPRIMSDPFTLPSHCRISFLICKKKIIKYNKKNKQRRRKNINV
jgi:hypothetical protein